MKKLILILLIINSISTFSKEVKVKSDIKEVTVFLSGASVTSVGSTNLSAGANEIVFENLSPYIDASSILAKGEGSFTILGVSLRTNYLMNQPKPKEIKALEDSLEAVQLRLELLKSHRSVYENEESFLLANKNIGGANTGVSAADMERIANMLRTRLPEIKNKIVESKVREKKLNEEILKISSQLAELNAGRNKSTGEIVVLVSAKAPGVAKLTLSYNVSGAGWVPVYDLRATDSNSPIKLDFRANVFQNTGDDWKDVKLTLSTGNPSLSGTKPSLPVWWLNYYNPNASKHKQRANFDTRSDGYAPAPAQQAQSEMLYDKKVAKEKADYSYDYTTVSEGQTNFQYEISIPYNIPSDRKEHAVSVQSYNIPATYKYFSVPKIEKDVFLVAMISGWDQYNLIAGDANIFFEGTFVGKSYLNTMVTNDTLDISLGRDKNVIVTRELLKDVSGKKFLGSNKRETRSYEISLRNKKNREIEIEIEDQVPLSKQQDIEVEVQEISAGAHNKDTGKITWTQKIAPTENKKLKLTYSVKYPKDKVISNL
jgi:uncharacterized protein (TIGR02231 family)